MPVDAFDDGCGLGETGGGDTGGERGTGDEGEGAGEGGAQGADGEAFHIILLNKKMKLKLRM